MTKEKEFIRTEKAYIKLYKQTKGYNWEIKGYEDTDFENMNLLKEKINKLNDELLEMFAGEI